MTEEEYDETLIYIGRATEASLRLIEDIKNTHKGKILIDKLT